MWGVEDLEGEGRKALTSILTKNYFYAQVIVLGGSIGKTVDIRRLRSMVYRLLLPGFKPRITKTRLRYAVAAGAALLAAYSPAPKPP